MNLQNLLQDALELIGENKNNAQNFDFIKLKGGGSDRTFIRLKEKQSDKSFIVIKYELTKNENQNYADLAEILYKNNIAVPKLIAKDSQKQINIFQDLGDILLWDCREQDWQTQKKLYQASLDELAKIFKLNFNKKFINKITPLLQEPFDSKLYHWEQNYFFDNFVANYCNISPTELGKIKNSQDLKNLAEILSSFPRYLVHRDFQSKNIMIVAEVEDGSPNVKLIDFQGMRLGLPTYDIASLIFAPYVNFNEEQTRFLLDYAFDIFDFEFTYKDFYARVYMCGVQRLMQALGAFGFLTLKKGKKIFQNYIPFALEKLSELAKNTEILTSMEKVKTSFKMPNC